MANDKTRYTDAELDEFKALIHKKLEEAQEDYKLLKGSLSHNDDHGTDDTGRTFNMMEDERLFRVSDHSTKPYTAKVKIEYTVTNGAFSTSDFVILNI